MVDENFEELLNTFSEQVLSTAMRILGDRASAQDVHQDVFIAIWKRWHRFDGDINWRGYLYRTTVRRALEIARSWSNHNSQKHSMAAAPNQRPDEELSLRELQRKLAAELSRLPKRQAHIFVLLRIEGFSSAQVAEILDCSPKTVRVHLHRATKRLAQKLGECLQ